MHTDKEPGTAKASDPEALELEAMEIDFLQTQYDTCSRCPFYLAEKKHYHSLPYHPRIYYGIGPAFVYSPPPSLQAYDYPTGELEDSSQIFGYHQPTCSGFYYTVRYGDTLWARSLRFGIGLQAIMAANPGIYDPNRIYAGQVICIPFPAAPRPCHGFHYTVRSGDSLYTISQHYGISLSTLIRANPQIMDPNIIYPGQIICVPIKKAHKPCKGFLYTARPGDTIHKIAQRFGIQATDIRRANPQITDHDQTYPGQTICIPDDHKGYLYTIQRGDKLFDIACRNEISLAELVAANPELLAPNLFFVGQVIYIPPGPNENGEIADGG